MLGDDTCTAQWLSHQLCNSPAAASLSDDMDAASATGVLLLDCRSADEYLAGHVVGSLLVVVPSIMLRRLRNGAGSVPAALSDPSARALFTARCRTWHVVLYDDCGAKSDAGAGDSVAEVLMSRLKKDGCRVSYLLGGFTSFRRQYSQLCVERRPSAPCSAAAAAAGSGEVSAAAGHHHHGARGRLNDDIFALSNLRLSSSAPSSSSSSSSSCYVHDCSSSSSLRRDDARRPVRDDSPPPDTPKRRVAGAGLPFPVRVLPNLYLGDAATSRDLDCLRRHNIQYIVNVTADVDNAFEDDSTLTYMRIAITDHWSETPTSFFTSAINFIEEGRTKDVGVLVHCLAGVSRSVTVTVAYLMFSLSLSLEDAYEFLRRVRPNISPNFNFMGQLADFDQTLKYARDHCSCLTVAAPLLSLCENCRRQVKTYFSSPPPAPQPGDDVSTTQSSSSSPFSISSLTSSTSTHSLPSPVTN